MKAFTILKHAVLAAAWITVVIICAKWFIEEPQLAIKEWYILSGAVFVTIIALFRFTFHTGEFFWHIVNDEKDVSLKSIFPNMSRKEIYELMDDMGITDEAELFALFELESASTKDRGRVDILDLRPGDEIDTDYGEGEVYDKPFVLAEKQGFTIFVPVLLDGAKMTCSSNMVH